MKKEALALLGLAMLLSTAACGKKVVAQKPIEPPPVVAQPAPPPTPPFAQRAETTPPPRQTPADPPREAVMTPEQRATLNDRLARLVDALFDYDKATIRTDAQSALKDDVAVIRDILSNFPSQKLLIEGHCDERGSDEYNLALGDRRAKATEEFLSTMGIPAAQLTIISFGKARPVCTDGTEACYQKNRRAHVTAAP
jgi:peptidoglycan-associated lipoprotein